MPSGLGRTTDYLINEFFKQLWHDHSAQESDGIIKEFLHFCKAREYELHYIKRSGKRNPISE